MTQLHRRMSALLAFIALLAFVAGAGLDAISVIPGGIVLLLAVFLQPGEERSRSLEPLWRAAAFRPGPLFGLLFVAYVACATVVLVLGHLTRQARARHIEPPTPQPQFLARVALLSTFVLLISAAVFLFFPRVSRGWAVRPTPTRAVVGFSDRVSLAEHGARIEPN